MGVTAENLATKWKISREDQDAFAVESQRRAALAIAEGRFKSQIVPIVQQTRKGEVVFDTDEHGRPNTTLDALAKMKPAFKKDGTVTAGNASGINDGAIALGHPVGCSGAFIATKALYELQRCGGRYALVNMCIGGGQGIAAIFERL